MAEVNVHEAKTQFSKLLRRTMAGEEITIAIRGKPVARLVPYKVECSRTFGVDRDVFEVPEDFNEPLPDDVLNLFEE